jgi:cardiolipin synthase
MMAMLLALAALITFFPVLIVSPIVIALAWLGIALLIRAFRLKRRVRLRRRKLALRRRLTKIKESEASPGE